MLVNTAVRVALSACVTSSWCSSAVSVSGVGLVRGRLGDVCLSVVGGGCCECDSRCGGADVLFQGKYFLIVGEGSCLFIRGRNSSSSDDGKNKKGC